MKARQYIKNIKNAFLGKNTASPKTGGKRKSKTIVHTAKDRVQMEQDKLREACEDAVDPENSTRIDLYGIYENSWEDSQVIAEREKAESKLVGEPFEVADNGTDSEEKKALLLRPWFEKFITLAMYVEFWGYTLVEFQDQDENGEFIDVVEFPRRHVRPLEKHIVINETDTEGLPYDGKETTFYLIEVGDPLNLGKLKSISREVIWKNFARSDWSEYNERYGKPLLDFATDTSDEEELNRKVDMAQNFGANGFVVRDVDDEVSMLEAKNTSSGENFEKKARFCDEQISKLMNGQTGTSDEKSYVGAAEVHERVLDDFMKKRLRNVSNIVNYKLFPFLVSYGYPLEGCTFRFPILDHRTSKPDKPVKDDDDEGGSQKKKLNRTPFPKATIQEYRFLNATINQLLEVYLKAIYDGHLKPGEISPQIWQHNYKRLTEAIMSGSDLSFSGSNFDSADMKLLLQLEENVAVFAAFKNHQETQEIVKLMKDAKGKLRTFSQFRKEALKVSEKYNKHWLETEFNQAEASARMAKKWNDFQEAADLYPNLQYRAVMDKRTRDSHAKLNGIVKPINDKFWDRHYPPNGWGCRCSVTQTDKPITDNKDGLPDPDPGFGRNSGKSGEVFDREHGYFDKKNKGAEGSGEKLMRKHMRSEALNEASKKYAGKTIKTKLGNVRITRSGIREAINQPHPDYNLKNAALFDLDGVLKKGKLVGTAPDLKTNPMIKQYHYLEIDLHGTKTYAVIREMQNGDKVFYGLSKSKK